MGQAAQTEKLLTSFGAHCGHTVMTALTLPATLGAGIWNRCKYVPYQYQIAVCLEKLGKKAEADEIFRTILDIEIEFFSKMHLRELPGIRRSRQSTWVCSRRRGT